MIWEVFRQETADGAHTHCGNVHASDREMAKQFAVIQHGRRKPTVSLWVAPKESVVESSPDAITQADTADETNKNQWEAFFLPQPGRYYVHRGSVTATDQNSALAAARRQYEDDDESIWVVPAEMIGEVTETDVAFGGTTNKSYRFAQTYNVDPAAEEVEASEDEQIEAKKRRGES